MATESLDVRAASVSGNGKIHRVSSDSGTWVVEFLSEPRTSPQPMWFHVEAANTRGRPVRFVWLNADQALGSPKQMENDTPVLRADDGPWLRCTNTEILENVYGRRALAFDSDGVGEAVSAALCYPYSSADLEETLRETDAPVERRILGVTGQGRAIPGLRIASPKQGNDAGVYIVARQHAGETPGSWVLDGIIRALAQEQAGVEHIDWWIAPFVDLDGVENGDYGKDAAPYDFNRDWDILPMRPEVVCISRDMAAFKERYASRLMLDLHAPGHGEDGLWVYVPNAQQPAERREAVQSFADSLVGAFPELDAAALTREANYLSRGKANATLCTWAWEQLDRTPCVSLETSYQTLGGRTLDIAGYREVGNRIVSAILNWFDKRGVRR